MVLMKQLFRLLFILGFFVLPGCTSTVIHADPFYNDNDSDFPRDHLPLINPIEATRERPSAPWSLKLLNAIYLDIPQSHEKEILQTYTYYRVENLEKFAVEDNILMAYSSYVNEEADDYIKNNFYHWFVMIPGENTTQGFHTEEEFRQFIDTLRIQEPDWLTPDEAFDTFLETGCLEWFPDC